MRWRAHNYQQYYQVFNTRQLLAFNYLGDGVNYDWFADALTHFDHFLKITQQNRKQTEYVLDQPRQLRLLERKKKLRSKKGK